MSADLLRNAERLFHLDALFHARVMRVLGLLDDDLHAETGQRMSEHDSELAALAAAVTLLLDRTEGEP